MTTVSAGVDLVVPTVDCAHDMLALVGGKAAGLGALMRAGQRVPASFVVTSRAYLDYVAADPRQMTDAARRLVRSGYEQLCSGAEPGVPVAVRSSAAVEDSTDSSCAGQFLTHLGATGADEVVEHVEQCWESAFAPHVESYRANRRLDADANGVAVVVQELVHARAAGVMFTEHPTTGDRSLVVVEASYGLGEAVVGGEVTPDLFEVNKVTRQVHRRVLGSKSAEHVLAPDGGHVVTRPVAAERQAQWAVTDEELQRLVDMASQLEASFGRGLDIEWAIGTTSTRPDEEELFALQVRPITVSRRRDAGTRAGGTAIDIIVGRLSQQDAAGGTR
jgi:pyruvate, water dikinase